MKVNQRAVPGFGPVFLLRSTAYFKVTVQSAVTLASLRKNLS